MSALDEVLERLDETDGDARVSAHADVVHARLNDEPRDAALGEHSVLEALERRGAEVSEDPCMSPDVSMENADPVRSRIALQAVREQVGPALAVRKRAIGDRVAQRDELAFEQRLRRTLVFARWPEGQVIGFYRKGHQFLPFPQQSDLISSTTSRSRLSEILR